MKAGEKRPFSWRARGRSFIYAWRGIERLIREEHNARLHCAALAMTVTAGVLLGISATEWCLVAICIGAVFAAEAMNSAVEALADEVSPGYSKLIERGKDLAAGAVLITAIAAATVGGIIFIPKIYALFL